MTLILLFPFVLLVGQGRADMTSGIKAMLCGGVFGICHVEGGWKPSPIFPCHHVTLAVTFSLCRTSA